MTGSSVLITCRQMQNCLNVFRERFEARGISIEAPKVVQQLSEEDLMMIIGEFDGMIAGDDPLTATVLEHARRMKIISKWGVGTDGIDEEAATRLGIRITNTPNVFGDEVADVAAGYLVLLARQLHRMDASVRVGGWLKIEGSSLTGKRLGIVGFGDIGQAVARRGMGFGMKVKGSDVSDPARLRAMEMGIELVPLEDLLPQSDYVVLCCALTAETRHIMNDDTIALMPPGSRIINVARGGLIDEAALAGALRSGEIAGAALDVFETEPLPVQSDLRELGETCIFGTHNGSNTSEGVLRASALAVDNLLGGLR